MSCDIARYDELLLLIAQSEGRAIEVGEAAANEMKAKREKEMARKSMAAVARTAQISHVARESLLFVYE